MHVVMDSTNLSSRKHIIIHGTQNRPYTKAQPLATKIGTSDTGDIDLSGSTSPGQDLQCTIAQGLGSQRKILAIMQVWY